MMKDALVIARLGLAAVFFIAAIAKLADRRARGRHWPISTCPAALGVRCCLSCPLPSSRRRRRWCFQLPRARAAGSLVSLALFVVGLTRVLRRDEAPDCHCFDPRALS